jgi:trimeric autotransporter adhesin
VFIGDASGSSLTSGSYNTMIGSAAGDGLVTGNNNILIGNGAGVDYNGSESNNIIVGPNAGEGGENFVIRIGDGNTYNNCFISGIWGSTVEYASALSVYVDQYGSLGTIASSARFKKDVQPIGSDSSPILDFHTISFVSTSDPSKTKQFGLLAEQVSESMPDLVIYDNHGQPYAVRYNELPVLVLNEVQKLESRVAELESVVAALEAKVATL